MAKRLSAQIRSKNQITLPKRLVDHADLKEGDFLDFELLTTAGSVEPGVIVLRKKHLTSSPLPADPVPAARDDGEFPGVKSAIEALKKGLK
ncbi:MAG: AbrB/MazE/SpoVT family DNA-binding domain-containing protein [Calditrichaeota bacterium]|nr:AbrB/MazE/SpoVT family DNA-binding domain-containing protein [Calditrichota bacterium]